MRPEIGDEWIGNAAQGFAPRLLGKNRITTDSQDLAIQSFELGELRFVGRNLLVSNSGKGKGVESEHYILLAAIITQLDFESLHFGFGDDAGRGEIRRNITDFEFGHGLTSIEKFITLARLYYF